HAPAERSWLRHLAPPQRGRPCGQTGAPRAERADLPHRPEGAPRPLRRRHRRGEQGDGRRRRSNRRLQGHGHQEARGELRQSGAAGLMHFVIDGHNLIAKMPGISLSDPDDEAQLILRLRRWVAANPKRRVTVYFDGGLPGGRAPHLSATRLEVVFASSGQPADDLLLRHLRRIKNPPEYTLVTSDRKIVAAAEKRRVTVLLSEDFAPELAEDATAAPPPPREVVEKPLLSEAEVAAWMELFGPEPEIPKQPRRPRLRRAEAGK